MLTTLEKLQKIEARRPTPWQVTAPTSPATRDCPPSLARALYLRDLELTVKDWTVELVEWLDADHPEQLATDTCAIAAILNSHAKDEDKHDEQLRLLSEYWSVGAVDDAGKDLIDRWNKDESHPLAKKLVLEAMGLFQALAIYQLAAPDDLFTAATRQWIMFDESAHVASARILVKAYQVSIPRSLYQLGVDTVEYLTEFEPPDVQDRMMSIAVGILQKGKAPEAAGLSTVANPEFFTQSNNSRIPYSA